MLSLLIPSLSRDEAWGPIMSAQNGAYVYIVRCRDGKYYVGTTRSSLERRIAEHNEGIDGGFTSHRRPVILVYWDYFERITDAIAAERRLKGRSRAKKEALMDGDLDRLRELSRSRKPKSHPSTGSG